jgi:hypothetical protein
MACLNKIYKGDYFMRQGLKYFLLLLALLLIASVALGWWKYAIR